MIIGICDDEKHVREQIYKVCINITEKYRQKVKVVEYRDGGEIDRDDLDILILDIEMPLKNGLQVKEQLQVHGKKTIIIFVTNHDEMIEQAFGLNVIGFIMKKHIQEQLPIMLENAINMVRKSIVIEGIDSDDIEYIKTEHVYSGLHLENGEKVLIRITGKALEKQLVGTGFIRIHRAYLVNMKHIDTIKNGKVIINSHVELKASDRLKAKVEREYDMYCRKNARFC